VDSGGLLRTDAARPSAHPLSRGHPGASGLIQDILVPFGNESTPAPCLLLLVVLEPLISIVLSSLSLFVKWPVPKAIALA
jgi:hypothetical protein